MASDTLDQIAIPMAPPPKPHHRTSSSIAQSPDSPRRADTFKRMSTASIATPISTTSTRPNSMITAYTDEPSEISSPASRKSLSVDTNPFLTAVATQERRVLELREELQKAESELQALKKNWAHQEATKKRTELRQNAEAMRPLKSPSKPGSASTPTVDTFRQSMEEERRRAMHAHPRIPERRVFEGRHTRTLSLLSPGTLANRAPPHSEQSAKPTGTPQTPQTAALPSRDLDGASDEAKLTGRPHANSRGAGDDIVNTGKQLVGDLREGLWSFWDDLRQATVGEEALKEPPNRRPSQQGRLSPRPGALTAGSRNNSSSTLQQPPSRRDSRSPHARSNTVAGTISATPSTPARSTQKLRLATTIEGETSAEPEDGGWSNWDSPAAKTASGSAGTASSPASTPRTSVSSNEDNLKSQKTTSGELADSMASKSASEQGLVSSTVSSTSKEGLPWPALKKLRPSSLQRTASNLMKEWERSLTPPAEEAEKDWIDKYIDGPLRFKAKEEKGTST